MSRAIQNLPEVEPAVAKSSLSQSMSHLQELLDVPVKEAVPDLVAHSPQMQAALEQAIAFAQTGASVLLTGESGCGKEVMARLIHCLSPRAERRYVRVNCAALAETLLESELFGHERGAFTGADGRRLGRLEYAADGTLLLDEISEIPIATQAKLLRVLEEKEFQRLGSNQTQYLQARVIATSNRNLAAEVAAGRFRLDLLYRLNVLQIEIPPLRQRREDLVQLAQQFLDAFRHEAPTPVESLGPQAIEQLLTYDWPGNVRELRNVIHRACILTRGRRVERLDLPTHHEATPAVLPFPEMPLEDVEREIIVATLNRHHGNKAEVARILGVTPRTLANKLKRYRELGYVA